MKRIWSSVVWISLFCIPVSSTSVRAQESGAQGQRRALLIGVTNYSQLSQLGTPVENVRGLAEELTAMQFRVDQRIEQSPEILNNDAMLSTLKEFSLSIQPGDIAFVYFSGHGIRVNGQQYILASDGSSPATGGKGIPVNWISDILASRQPKAVFIVVEACTAEENPEYSRANADFPPSNTTFLVLAVGDNLPTTDRAEARTGRSFF